MLTTVLIAVISLLIIGFIISTRMNSKTTNQLSSSDFISLYKSTDKATMIDVRTPGEYMSKHLPGARNIDVSDPSFASKIKALDKEGVYFVYCRSGGRSRAAVSLMNNLGFTHIYELKGGMMGM